MKYDENNNKVETLVEVGIGGSWRNDYKHTYTYQAITSLEQIANEIIGYFLSNNYPNPFNPGTKIEYSIPIRSNVKLKVLDILGSDIATLVNIELIRGNYEV